MMALHVRHMGVAEEGDPIGVEVGYPIHGCQHALGVLVRQAVHEVAV